MKCKLLNCVICSDIKFRRFECGICGKFYEEHPKNKTSNIDCLGIDLEARHLEKEFENHSDINF